MSYSEPFHTVSGIINKDVRPLFLAIIMLCWDDVLSSCLWWECLLICLLIQKTSAVCLL